MHATDVLVLLLVTGAGGWCGGTYLIMILHSLFVSSDSM
jgi:hypothetical protein